MTEASDDPFDVSRNVVSKCMETTAFQTFQYIVSALAKDYLLIRTILLIRTSAVNSLDASQNPIAKGKTVPEILIYFV